MAVDPNAVEQAVSRALRDNLEKIQHTSEELHRAVSDLIAACASSRPSNALPPMVRAQTSAASLSATLEVLSKFVTGALQPSVRVPFEPEELQVPSMASFAAPPQVEQPTHAPPHPTHVQRSAWTARPPAAPPPPIPLEPEPEEFTPAEAPEMADAPSEVELPLAGEPAAMETEPEMEVIEEAEPVGAFFPEPGPDVEPILLVDAEMETEPAGAESAFSLDSLSPEEQELHRRAYRVAKVSMQDIKMLRPEEVRLGREKKDLCFRLRDEIEKAHKEYDRRFQSIQSHPVDYFYDWMVEILGGGDPKTLGAYPYPSPVLRR